MKPAQAVAAPAGARPAQALLRLQAWSATPVGNLWSMSLLVMTMFWLALGGIAALEAADHRSRQDGQLAAVASALALYYRGEHLGCDPRCAAPSLRQLSLYPEFRELLESDGEIAVVERATGAVVFSTDASTFVPGVPVAGAALREALREQYQGVERSATDAPGTDLKVAFRAVADGRYAVLAVSRSINGLSASMVLLAGIGGVFTLFKSKLTLTRVKRLREQQTLIAQLERSREQEHRANAMKSEFVASISHELRTPLNSILGFSNLIELFPDAAETKRHAHLINTSGHHLLSLVNTLLDLAKIEAGRMDVEHAEIDIAALVQEVVDFHRQAAQAKGLALSLQLPLQPVGKVRTDPTKLTQILNNLLSNAIKFTDAGAVRLTLGIASEQLLIGVADSGRGIAPERLPRVFERFNSLAGEQSAGTGLGLALSRDLAHLMGGTLEVRSQPQAGTQVALTLPLQAAGPAPAA